MITFVACAASVSTCFDLPDGACGSDGTEGTPQGNADFAAEMRLWGVELEELMDMGFTDVARMIGLLRQHVREPTSLRQQQQQQHQQQQQQQQHHHQQQQQQQQQQQRNQQPNQRRHWLAARLSSLFTGIESHLPHPVPVKPRTLVPHRGAGPAPRAARPQRATLRNDLIHEGMMRVIHSLLEDSH